MSQSEAHAEALEAANVLRDLCEDSDQPHARIVAAELRNALTPIVALVELVDHDTEDSSEETNAAWRDALDGIARVNAIADALYGGSVEGGA